MAVTKGNGFPSRVQVNILDRGSQVHDMAEFQEILDFPPSPKLDVFGKLDPKKATPQELHGQEVFFGKDNVPLAPYGSLLHRQPDAQPARRAFLQGPGH
jgi:hypothetical protein